MGMHPVDFDPWRLRDQTRPLPVEGRLSPVCPADELVGTRHHPTWFRVMAGAMALLFAAATVLTTFATAGRFSLLTDAGNFGFKTGSAVQR